MVNKKAFIFDADGVVINRPMVFSRVLEKDHGITIKQTKDFFTGPFQECLVGTGDLKQLLPEYLNKWNWEGGVDEFLRYWFKSEHYIDLDLIKGIDTLRKRGGRFYIATNQEKYRTEYIRSDMGLHQHFDDIFSSAYLGVTKPHKSFYDSISSKLENHDIYFWDDDEDNVRAARETGWRATHYSRLDDFTKVINNL
ncbi:MAG: HAD family hydrolase [Patescibacteria group bacterium]